MQKSVVIVVFVVILILVGGFFFVRDYGNPKSSNDGLESQSETPVQEAGGNETLPQNISEIKTETKTYEVLIKGYEFSPETLTVSVGDTVIWTNKDNSRHTVTSDSGSEIQSGSLSKEGVYSHAFTKAGNYDYHCGLHSGMKGKIVVQ